ncbi:acyl-CoA dehydrogenase NM domain-like protein [Mollisia scopiformis]|uniref:Acyl-CoA dehydrogenase NM domain-like protein n=1 Tax=Mollisia scopiformis TaxID=149040 RepID=A0A194XDY6_MOLSC|nr:acyl-CoA dehydrogenase NM domain-like protein [Mollisia scopiformis]KUJ17962.1 acyl-CoA dehydrogenase NM domain-like protein [Mollisia scopiformis]
MPKAFGSTSPWADPAWYSGRPSPYYNARYVKLRDWVRKWTEDNVVGNEEEWEKVGKIPDDVYEKCARDGLLVPIAFGNRIPREWGHYPIAAGIKAEEWNGFHDFILWDELFRGASSISSQFIGLVVGAPPLKQYASPALQKKILPEILSGKKRICLAITEPSAGSDVRNITTTAEKTPDGKHYIVNGEKKWITNGIFSDYFMTTVRTGGAGASGMSMLLIPRLPGLKPRKIEIGGSSMGATTYVTFEDVKVPAEYLVGQEGGGFKYTMSNFNHERLWIAFQALRGSRICLEDAMTWCQKREAFGKTLIEQPVVRHKFGHMARQIDGLQSWIESLIYELENMSHAEGSKVLGGATALLKVQAGIVAKYIADESQKLMGGLGLTKTGQGARIESIARAIPTLIVPGGSEDVLLDLGVREALKLSAAAKKAKL